MPSEHGGKVLMPVAGASLKIVPYCGSSGGFGRFVACSHVPHVSFCPVGPAELGVWWLSGLWLPSCV